jgi:hypothetical protein
MRDVNYELMILEDKIYSLKIELKQKDKKIESLLSILKSIASGEKKDPVNAAKKVLERYQTH